MEKQIDEVNSQETAENDRIERLEVLLQESLEMNREMKAMVRHINTYVAWQKIFGWLKLLLILIPLIIGFIYLPPLFKDLYQQGFSMISGGACQ